MNGGTINTSTFPIVVGKDGLRGRLQTETGDAGTLRGLVLLRLEDGRQILIPQDILHMQDDGSFLLPLNLAELEQAYSSRALAEEESLTVSVVAEELHVGTRIVQTGRVLLHKTVQEQEEIVDPPLLRHSVVVERVAINRLCDGPAPGIRHEGDVMILPVLEEVLVVEKRLLLKEEIHIRQEQSTFQAPQRVMVRREEVQVERVAIPNVSENLEEEATAFTE